jgi:ArsR family metal-binding transcriptional regulator
MNPAEDPVCRTLEIILCVLAALRETHTLPREQPSVAAHPGFVDSIQLVKTLPRLADVGKLIVVGEPSWTLDGLLPLDAAVAPNVIAFNPVAGTLTLRRKAGFITFYPDRVMITQVQDTSEGLALLDEVRTVLNQRWEHRDTIQPVTAIRRAPRPLDVWSPLPQTDCRRCGEATRMALAFALPMNQTRTDACRPLSANAAFADRRAQLEALVLQE